MGGVVQVEDGQVLGGAVVLVGDEDNGQRGVLADEAVVVRLLGQRDQSRLHLLLEATPANAKVGDAREVLGDGGAGPGEIGRVGRGAAGAAGLVHQLALIADEGTARRLGPARADVRGDHAHVVALDGRRDGLDSVDELGEVAQQVGLLLAHGVGVIDDEEDVDGVAGVDGGLVPVPRVLDRHAIREQLANVALVGHEAIRGGEGDAVADATGQQKNAEDDV